MIDFYKLLLTAFESKCNYDFQEKADNGSAEHLLSMLQKVPSRDAEDFDR